MLDNRKLSNIWGSRMMHDRSDLQEILLKFNSKKVVKLNKSIYVAKIIETHRVIDILGKNTIPPRGIDVNLAMRLRITENLHEADFVLVPHEWVAIFKNKEYINYLMKLSERKVLVLFNTGDVSPEVRMLNTIQIRTFLHPWENEVNKIIVPYPAKPREWKPREWKPKPAITFMGQLPHFSIGSIFSFSWKSIIHPILSSVYLHRKIGAFKLNKLANKFDVQIVIREKFTAYKTNLEFNKLSREFQTSLDNTDFVLCPRGFGNTSIRFYEAISAGRIPILIRSGSPLPNLADQFKWDNHIVEVDLFDNWEKQISVFWNRIGNTSTYQDYQQKNVELFSKLLNYKSFIEGVFSEYLHS